MVAEARAFGVSAQQVGIDFGRVRDHIHATLAGIAPNDSKERLTGLGVQVIEAAARFKDRETVTVGEIDIKARRFVIATGSSPAVPAIPGLKAVAPLTTDTVFGLTECPQHLIVIGAGAVGLALAQAFRRLGAEVTVLDPDDPLVGEDPEFATLLLDAIARDGIVVRTGVVLWHIDQVQSKVQVSFGDTRERETVEGSHLLVAGGRRANVEGLGLEQAGIRYDRSGIVVGKGLKTTNRRVYAIGDVLGGPASLQSATYQADVVVQNALFDCRRGRMCTPFHG